MLQRNPLNPKESLLLARLFAKLGGKIQVVLQALAQSVMVSLVIQRVINALISGTQSIHKAPDVSVLGVHISLNVVVTWYEKDIAGR
jgi:hypothetical protein